MNLISFHNDEKLKQKYIARTDKHLEMDNLIQGDGWSGTKGCHVGCTLNKYDHKSYESELGLPEWIARLCDTLHEGQTIEDAKVFFRDFLRSIPVGKDLTVVKWRFSSYLMEENLKTLESVKSDESYWKKCVDSVSAVKLIFDNAINSGELDESARSEARSAAASAARSARSAAYENYANKLLELMRGAK